MPPTMEESAIRLALAEMEVDNSLNTQPNYVRESTEIIKLLSFQEWHMDYLTGHPKVNAQNYLTNLRVMIKVRP